MSTGGRPARMDGGFKGALLGWWKIQGHQLPVERRIQCKIRYEGNTPIRLRCLRQRLERVHLGGEIGGGGRQWRAARGEPKTVQNFSCRVGRMYCGKDFQPSAASFTLEDVQQKDSHHEMRPSIVSARGRVLCDHFDSGSIVDAWCAFLHGNRNGGR